MFAVFAIIIIILLIIIIIIIMIMIIIIIIIIDIIIMFTIVRGIGSYSRRLLETSGGPALAFPPLSRSPSSGAPQGLLVAPYLGAPSLLSSPT